MVHYLEYEFLNRLILNYNDQNNNKEASNGLKLFYKILMPHFFTGTVCPTASLPPRTKRSSGLAAAFHSFTRWPLRTSKRSAPDKAWDQYYKTFFDATFS